MPALEDVTWSYSTDERPTLVMMTDGPWGTGRAINSMIDRTAEAQGWRVERTVGRDQGTWFTAVVHRADLVLFFADAGGSADLGPYVTGYCEATDTPVVWVVEDAVVTHHVARFHTAAERQMLVWSKLRDLQEGLERVIGGQVARRRPKVRELASPDFDPDALTESYFVELVEALLRADGFSILDRAGTPSRRATLFEFDGEKFACLIGRDVERWLSTGSRPSARLGSWVHGPSSMGVMLVPRPGFFAARPDLWGRLRDEGVTVISPPGLLALIRRHPEVASNFVEGVPSVRRGRSLASAYRRIALLEEERRELLAAARERDAANSATLRTLWEEATYSAAHKVRNPLYALETEIDNLDACAEPAQQEMIVPIRSSLERAKTIVHRFVGLAQYGDDVTVEHVRIAPLLADALNIAHLQGAGTAIDCPDDVVVWSDEQILIEVLEELVANSLFWLTKAQEADRQLGRRARPRSIRVRVAPYEVDDDVPFGDALSSSQESWFRIDFVDNGLGIDREELETVFYPGISRKEQGTGLGLAIQKKGIEACGGFMCARDSSRGAWFSIYLKGIHANDSSRG